MSGVRFSVVIPTRERAATLAHALRTCVEQDHDDFEVIVSDNDGSPATREAVEAAGSPRVRYVRTPRLLSMSSNWDFALSHARGEYVVLIGDDDGLLPHALPELDRLTREHRPAAVRWEAAYYSWPTFALPGQENYLRIPVGRGLTPVESRAAVADVAGFRAGYTALPMLYNAAVHRDVLAELRRRAGRVFPHPIPDVYSGFVVALAAGRFLSCEAPMTIAGQAGGSYGVATIFNRGRSPLDREFRALNADEGLANDPRVPDLPVFPHVYVADSFLAAKRLFPDEAAGIDLDRMALAAALVRGLPAENDEEWQAGLARIRESLADDPALVGWFDEHHAAAVRQPVRPFVIRPARLGHDGGFLHLDAAAHGVADVHAAAQLCEKILNYRRNGVPYGPPGGDLQRVCDERLAAIGELKRICDERAAIIDGLQEACAQRQAVLDGLRSACDERAELITTLDRLCRDQVGEIEQLARACTERLRVIEVLNDAVQKRAAEHAAAAQTAGGRLEPAPPRPSILRRLTRRVARATGLR